MKKICMILLCLILAAVAASAQAMNNRQMLKRLGLTDDQISQFSVIQQQALPEIRSAQADMRQAKEALAQLLMDPRADPQEIDRRVHAVTDAEARLRIAQIRREMAVRQLIGDRAWQKLVLSLRLRRELLREDASSPTR
jgi:parvulin-like peptidyl-prolyl isomerase